MKKIGVLTAEFLARKTELIAHARQMFGDSVVADAAQQNKLTELAICAALARGEQLPQKT